MSAPAEDAPLAGMLVIDKPLRLTSMGACAAVRTRLRRGGAPKRVKVGHAGTLDPLATGVLVVLVGRATRLVNTVMATEKRYLAEVDLSRTSPTDDLEAETTPVAVDTPPTPADIQRVLAERFTGEIEQAPPAHSAMQIGGVRAYELARAGKISRLEPRPVVIHEIAIERYTYPLITLRVRCGKGTYIRSLARDLGVELGTGGVLSGLRRTAVGPYTDDQAAALESLPREMTQGDLLPPPG